MPIHDWTRVDAGLFHAFRYHWIGHLSEALNAGVLPPLTLASYDAGPPPPAYVEPIAVGDVLPGMPIFLKPGFYVPAPLEATYQETWSRFPTPMKRLLEAPAEESRET